MKVTENRGDYVLTDMHVEPSLRAKRSNKSPAKKSEHSGQYRKPKQVDGMSILRRSGEPWRRN